MPFHFCPQCGTKLQPDFRFCPSCGEKLPCPVEASGLICTTSHLPTKAVNNKSLGLVCSSSVVVSPRPPLGKTRHSSRFAKQDKSPTKQDTTLFQGPPSVQLGSKGAKDDGVDPDSLPPQPQAGTAFKAELEPAPEVHLSATKSPTPVKGKGRASKHGHYGKRAGEETDLPNRSEKEEEESAVDGQKHPVTSPTSSPASKRLSIGRGKVKKAKRDSPLKPIGEGEQLTDTAGRKWRLGKVLSQTETDLVYEVLAATSKDYKHILKLGAKDGRIFNEQNFLQRAAKPTSVDKWMKCNKLDFLGIPSCVGFGLHADNYRFLIFPSMGETLQSIMEEGGKLLSEKVVLQLACRILDVLEFIHSHEYVHGDINAESIYIKTGEQSQVYLAGYCHAFRYCPGGQHVEYREASRPSRRSDLQCLAYCLLQWHTGTLPWAGLTDAHRISTEKQRFVENVPALLSNCIGRNRVSGAVQQYVTEVMALGYSDTPDYAVLKAGFTNALLQLGGAMEQPLSF